ncbi:MAG: hypothetical protein ACLP8B_01690, partial [Xanthobacteraceae bacterium]
WWFGNSLYLCRDLSEGISEPNHTEIKGFSVLSNPKFAHESAAHSGELRIRDTGARGGWVANVKSTPLVPTSAHGAPPGNS